MIKQEDNKTKEEENNIIENAKEIITEKKDNGGETLKEKVKDIKDEIKEITKIPLIIETNEIIKNFREENLKQLQKEKRQRGPCQKCQCIIF